MHRLKGSASIHPRFADVGSRSARQPLDRLARPASGRAPQGPSHGRLRRPHLLLRALQELRRSRRSRGRASRRLPMLILRATSTPGHRGGRPSTSSRTKPGRASPSTTRPREVSIAPHWAERSWSRRLTVRQGPDRSHASGDELEQHGDLVLGLDSDDMDIQQRVQVHLFLRGDSRAGVAHTPQELSARDGF